ncbi:YxeA family protein [Staphylococcus edaphicus]|uniref:YxeA family protein n=1 Tax=Staphylococcus edaphicus TaxID=1955013 RepID=UPI001EE6A2AD|nr:YxeA family protein [Staphylococcus edaphicus]
MIALSIYTTKSSHSDNEALQLMDQLNPLTKEKDAYIITKRKPDQLLEHNRVEYTQDAVDENGNVIKLTITAVEKLQPNRYLRVPHKGKHVETFEEVSEKQVPSETLKKLHTLD